MPRHESSIDLLILLKLTPQNAEPFLSINIRDIASVDLNDYLLLAMLAIEVSTSPG